MFTRVSFPGTYIGVSFTKQACGQRLKQFSNLDSLQAKAEMFLSFCGIHKASSSVILEGREGYSALESSKVKMLNSLKLGEKA